MDRYMASEMGLLDEEVQIDDQRNRNGKWVYRTRRTVRSQVDIISCQGPVRGCACVSEWREVLRNERWDFAGMRVTKNTGNGVKNE